MLPRERQTGIPGSPKSVVLCLFILLEVPPVCASFRLGSGAPLRILFVNCLSRLTKERNQKVERFRIGSMRPIANQLSVLGRAVHYIPAPMFRSSLPAAPNGF